MNKSRKLTRLVLELVSYRPRLFLQIAKKTAVVRDSFPLFGSSVEVPKGSFSFCKLLGENEAIIVVVVVVVVADATAYFILLSVFSAAASAPPDSMKPGKPPQTGLEFFVCEPAAGEVRVRRPQVAQDEGHVATVC